MFSIGATIKKFKKLGYSNSLSMLFSSLLTLKGELPQGAPTSPALSNLIMRIIDDQIAKYSVERKIRYTRYADDLTFSGDFDHEAIRFGSSTTLLCGWTLVDILRQWGSSQKFSGRDVWFSIKIPGFVKIYY